MDPFYSIDIPRITRSAEAAIRRSKTFRDRLNLHKRCRERYPEHTTEPLDENDLFPFAPSEVGRFLEFLDGMVREREEKAELRHAVNIMITLLDPCSCHLSHCEHCWRGAPMSCIAGKNPRTCPKAAAYRDKKSADHEECQACQHRVDFYRGGKRTFFKGYNCNVKRNADRPANCPKAKEGKKV
jgi:hypothetical protein